MAAEQAAAKRSFQGVDAAGHGGRADAEVMTGLAEVAAAGDREEVAKIVPRHQAFHFRNMTFRQSTLLFMALAT